MKFPDQGEIILAKDKKYQELVFFVPPHGSSRKKIHPHIELINELGFDAFTFKVHDEVSLWNLPLATNFEIGFQHRIAEQIENLLNSVDRNKIIFSFGDLTTAAIEAISRRHASDIKALICESGPSQDFIKSLRQAVRFDSKTSLKKALQGSAFTLLWNPLFKNTLSDNLKSLPNGFKILSVRGWKDKLISPSEIDAIFEPHSQLDWRKLSLPSAGNLDGLKKSALEYRSGLEKFLMEIGQKL